MKPDTQTTRLSWIVTVLAIALATIAAQSPLI